MNKNKIIILIMAFFLSLSFKVNADTCPSSEMNRLKNLANKVDLTYDYEWKVLKKVDNVDYMYPVFYITAINLNKELKVMIENDYLSDDYLEFVDNGTGSGTLKNFNYGQTIEVTIRAFTSNDCAGKIVATKKVSLPYFNVYHYDDVCEDNKDFKYCSMFLENNISSEKFAQELEKFIKNGNKNVDDASDESNIRGAFNTYLLIVGVVLIVVILLITIVIYKNKKKNEL